MTPDLPAPNDPEDNHGTAATPEDIAGLYSWANLKDPKYRDFSGSRDRVRANARDRSEIEKSLQAGATNDATARNDVVETLPAAPSLPPRSPSLPSPVKAAAIRPEHPQGPHPERRRVSLAARTSHSSSTRGAPARWAALKNVFEDSSPKYQAPVEGCAPSLALVSLAGGVGKTSLVASLGRSLALHGDSVLLVDTGIPGLLPLYFGSHDIAPGNITTFPGGDDAAVVRIMTMDPEWTENKRAHEVQVAEKIAAQAKDIDRVLIDVSTRSEVVTRQVLRLSPTILMTLTPDMASVVSLPAARAFFQQLADETGQTPELYYILNQFDASLRLHADIRDVLASQLGDRLLPFAIRSSSAVSEALAEGMTIADYVPGSQIVEDLEHLSHWIRELNLLSRNEIHPIPIRKQSC